MKYLLLDVIKNDVNLVECNNLDDIYKYLKCSCIEITLRRLGDLLVRIVVDESGALKEDRIISITNQHDDFIFGNVLFASSKVVDGELTELTIEEMDYIVNFIRLSFFYGLDNKVRLRLIY